MAKRKDDFMKNSPLPYTLHGGMPGVWSAFGMGFVGIFIPVFIHFTGGGIDQGTSIFIFALSAFVMGVGFCLYKIRIEITDSGFSLYQLKSGNSFYPSFVNVSWDSIKKIDVGIKGIKNPGLYGPNQIDLIQVTCEGREAPIIINATYFRSDHGLAILGRYVCRHVPRGRITDKALNMMGQKVG